jgi:hypothetical protein
MPVPMSRTPPRPAARWVAGSAARWAAAGALLCVSPRALAQAEDAPPVARPPQLDTKAAATLAGWKKLRYHVASAGVKTLSYDIAVESKGGMTGTWKATGKYVFDGDPKHPYGVLTWEDEEIDHAMTRRGWTAEVLARQIRDDSLLLSLANAKVSAKTRPNGTILVVSGGKSPQGQFLLFDAAGRHIGEVVGPMKKRLVYREYRDQQLLTGESFRMEQTSGEMRYSHGRIGGAADDGGGNGGGDGVVVTTRATEVVQVDGRLVTDLTLTFDNFVVDGKAGAARPLPPEQPPGGTGPASRPTSRPPKSAPSPAPTPAPSPSPTPTSRPKR